jgi:hypothetical protein
MEIILLLHKAGSETGGLTNEQEKDQGAGCTIPIPVADA